MMGVEPTNNSISYFYYKVSISVYMLHMHISTTRLMQYRDLTGGLSLILRAAYSDIPLLLIGAF